MRNKLITLLLGVLFLQPFWAQPSFGSVMRPPTMLFGIHLAIRDMIKNPVNHIKHFQGIDAPVVTVDTTDLIKVKVKAVHDGDSWKVEFSDGRVEWVRIVGIDAPEVFSPYVLKTQPWGVEAGNVARNEFKGKTILIDTLPVPQNRDYYGRLLVEAYTNDKLISLSLVERGLAWSVAVPNRRSPNINLVLKNAQKYARQQKLGLFSEKRRPLRPETWRKRYKS